MTTRTEAEAARREAERLWKIVEHARNLWDDAATAWLPIDLEAHRLEALARKEKEVEG